MILYARCFTVNRPICIGIELRLECNTRSTCLESFLGDIEPHTESCSLHTICNVTENDYIISIEKHVIRPRCKSSIGIIKSPSKSIITVSNLTTLLSSSGKGFTAQIFVKLTCKRLSANERIVYTVILAPLLSLLEAHEACLITILKVPNNLRALTELNCISKIDIVKCNDNINTCNRGIVGSGKVKSVKDTCGTVRKSNSNCISIYVYVSLTCHRNDRKRNGTNLISGGVRNNSRCCRELKYLRICNCNGLRTNNRTCRDYLNVNCTYLTVRNELAVFDSTEGIIGKCPSCVSGHIHCVTVSIDCFCTKGVSSLRCKNVVA